MEYHTSKVNMTKIGSKTCNPIVVTWSLLDALSSSSTAFVRCSEASLDQVPVRWF